MTNHGNIRSYLHRCKIIESLERPWKQGIQTLDHALHDQTTHHAVIFVRDQTRCPSCDQYKTHKSDATTIQSF
jgi:hypothetical protein